MFRMLTPCLLLGLLLAPPLEAQTPEVPDITELRSSTTLDLAWVPPLRLQQVIAAAEDKTWFDSFPAASPITRQVVRSVMLSSERSLTRAAIELRLSIDMANAFSAQEIMSIFAQSMYLGGRCYGFEDALTHRLGVSLEDASLRDMLTLAVLINGPSFYEQDPVRLTQRFEVVAIQGMTAGFWTEAEADSMIAGGPTPFVQLGQCPIP